MAEFKTKSSQAQKSLWQHSDFLKLWGGQTISELGSRITREGLPLLAVLTLAATPAQMGLLSAVGSLPVLFFSLYAGVWVDRLRRRPIMIIADLSRALILASLPLAAVLGQLTFTHLLVVAALVGILSVVFDVAYTTYLPSLIDRSQLVDGNSKLALSSAIAEMAGPGAAGWLVQAITAPIALLIDAVSFLVSVLSIAAIRQPEPIPVSVEIRRPLLAELKEGIQVVQRNPILRSLAAAAASRSFFGSFFGVLYGLYAIRYLGLGPAALGLTIAAGGASDLLGALLARPAQNRFGLGPTLFGAFALSSLATCLIPLASPPLPLAIGLLLGSQLLGDGPRSIYAIQEISLRQAITPEHLLGRTNASLQFLVSGLGPLGALLGGALGSAIGVRPTLWIAALGSSLSLLWLIFSPIPRMLKIEN